MATARRTFTAYKKDELRLVETFKYLGHIIARGDCDMPAIRHNLKRTRQVWGGISKVIDKEEVAPKLAGMCLPGGGGGCTRVQQRDLVRHGGAQAAPRWVPH